MCLSLRALCAYRYCAYFTGLMLALIVNSLNDIHCSQQSTNIVSEVVSFLDLDVGLSENKVAGRFR